MTDSVNLTTYAGSTSANSSSNEPSYRTVAFIKLTVLSGIKTINGLARDSVKTIDGLSMGSVKSFDGLE